MISPGVGQAPALEVAQVYEEAELRILQRIARNLQQGIDAPDWEQQQLGRLQLLREEVLAELRAVNPQAAALIEQRMVEAYGTGQLSAYADAGATLPIAAQPTVAQQGAVAALVTEVTAPIADASGAILRAVDDVYRQVVAEGAARVLTGSQTRREAVQQVVGQLLGHGLNGITTERGRRMDLPTYAQLAVRTAVARSAIAGHEAAMDTLSLDLVIIHPGPRACDICDKWARQILSRRGPAGRVEVRNPRTGKVTTVLIRATLAEARAAGWGHPNCRCGLAAYIVGVTDLEQIKRPPWDQAAYEAQQRQRAIERQIRGWKQREALAITPDAAADAKAKVRAWQGAMRDHLDGHPALKRQSAREQMGAFGGNASAAKAPPGSRPLRTTRPTRRTPPSPAPPPPAPAQTARARATPVAIPTAKSPEPTLRATAPAGYNPPRNRKVNAGDLTPEMGQEIARLTRESLAGRLTDTEYRAAVRKLTGTDSRGRFIGFG